MEALSVSISRSTSPVEKESPSLTFQLAMFPSVMVGDMAGMVKLCASRWLTEKANVLRHVLEAIWRYGSRHICLMAMVGQVRFR